jgi:S1-C subfamily serine protease
VIGIITSKIIDKGIEGIAFAIPITTALTKLGIKIKD